MYNRNVASFGRRPERYPTTEVEPAIARCTIDEKNIARSRIGNWCRTGPLREHGPQLQNLEAERFGRRRPYTAPFNGNRRGPSHGNHSNLLRVSALRLPCEVARPVRPYPIQLAWQEIPIAYRKCVAMPACVSRRSYRMARLHESDDWKTEANNTHSVQSTREAISPPMLQLATLNESIAR